MHPMNETDFILYFLLGIGVLFVLIGMILSVASFVNDFSQELRLLNSEVRRTVGSERQYWIRRRRRLWLSILPFVRY